jgi:tetratricopeptide (TPR) repeat protein
LEAIKFYTLSLKYAQRGETYHNRGYCYIKTSQNDLAIKDLSKAMELDGSNLRILKTRIIAYKKMEKYDLMLKDINTYLEKDETNFNMRANKAIVLSLLEKPKEAIPIYNELIKEKPNEKKLYYGIGQLYLKTNQLNYALYNADKAIMLDGKYAKAYLLKSEILMAVNKKEESCRMFNKSIELGIDSNKEEYKMLKKYCNE